jgi:hypothetical protein
LAISCANMGTIVLTRSGFAAAPERIDAAWYAQHRQYASVPEGKIAYVEHGRGPTGPFPSRIPPEGYQWRGALEELHMHRRCFAPDFMGMGKTETHEGQIISPK